MINATGLLTWLRQKLNNRTEIGHALAGLFLWGLFTTFGLHQLAVAVPISYYLAREERDAEMRLIGSVWTKWPRAFASAIKTKDFLFPAFAVAAATAVRALYLAL